MADERCDCLPDEACDTCDAPETPAVETGAETNESEEQLLVFLASQINNAEEFLAVCDQINGSPEMKMAVRFKIYGALRPSVRVAVEKHMKAARYAMLHGAPPVEFVGVDSVGENRSDEDDIAGDGEVTL